jgi:hypothetical protein
MSDRADDCTAILRNYSRLINYFSFGRVNIKERKLSALDKYITTLESITVSQRKPYVTEKSIENIGIH